MQAKCRICQRGLKTRHISMFTGDRLQMQCYKLAEIKRMGKETCKEQTHGS